MTVSQWGRILVDEIEGADVPKGELWVWPLGGASICVRSSESLIYIDPYTGSPTEGPWIRMVAVPYDPADLRRVDAVFSTHDHDDHCHEATLRPIGENTQAPFIGPASSVHKMHDFGLPTERIIEATDGQVFTFGDMTVRAVGILDHSDPTSLGWLVSADDGPTLLDAGDSMYGTHFSAIAEVAAGAGHGVDAATLSVADLADDRKIYMDPDDLIRAGEDLGLHVLIPKHWDLWRNVWLDPWEVLHAAERHRSQFGVLIPRLGDAIHLRRE
jgi:L-ascorbate 6-phosphate lactonase